MPVLLYAFQNWDLFAVAALVVGLLAYERETTSLPALRSAWVPAVKLFPAVVVPPLVALRWVSGDHAGARRLAASAVGVFVAVNLPVAIANPSGWWWPFSFQSHRPATWGSAWFYLFRVMGLPVHGASGAQFANMVSIVALAGGLGWLLFVTVDRRLAPFAVAAAAVAIFMLCNKVYSPTYDVWLVVFFVMLPFSRRLWLTFCAVDLAVFATVYGYFGGFDSVGFVRVVLPVLVVVRTGVLLTVVVGATRRISPRSPDSPVPQPSRST